MDETFISYACDILGKTAGGLTGSEIAKYFVEYAMQFDRKLKFTDSRFSNDGQLLSKRDGLKENLYCFKDNEKYFILNDLCNKPKFVLNDDVKKLKIKLVKTFPELNDIEGVDEKLDAEIINNTKHWLDSYSSVLALYSKAIENYKLKSFERSVLDDMRLALEMLLKEIFSNSKSLENQIASVGALVSAEGRSPEFVNMFNKLIDYYCKYQNTYVKHNDKVNVSEVEFIIEMTSIFMRNLIKIKQNGS